MRLLLDRDLLVAGGIARADEVLGHHGQEGADDGSGEVEPQRLQGIAAGEDSRAERASRIHRSAADRTAEQGIETYGRTDGSASHDSLFLGAGRHAKNDE